MLVALDVPVRFVPDEIGRVDLFDGLWVALVDKVSSQDPRPKTQERRARALLSSEMLLLSPDYSRLQGTVCAMPRSHLWAAKGPTLHHSMLGVEDGVLSVGTELSRPDLSALPVAGDAVLPSRPHAEGGLGEVDGSYGLGQPLVAGRVDC